jgi:dihydroorotase
MGADTIIDGTNKILMPGLFDPHVHFRDPGFTYKEDFETGSKAAISAGVTTIFDMPNTNPPVFTTENLAKKREIVAPKAHCNYGLFFGAGPNNLEEIKAAKNIPGVKLYLNTTTGNLKMDNEEAWREIFNLGRKVVLHAEGDTFFRAVEIWTEENFPCELHLAHASLKSEIDLIRELKNNPESREKISVEVCPHHLFMTHKEREKHGAICCMKPELATQKDLDAMWIGVEDGTIDFFATDHAPHTLAEKKESDRAG